jgi:DNA-binding GntR family transcriptional regulator
MTTRDATPYAFLSALPRQGRGGTTQRVHDVVREAIIGLAIAPGEFIDKAAICKRLGVSRFPVSEALGRLADEGFVEILPQRGTRVSRIDIAACRQAMFIRRALECEAMPIVAARASDRLIEALEKNLEQQKLAVEQGDALRFYGQDLAFHEILLAELGYDRVKSVVESARGSLDRIRLFLLRTPQRPAKSYAEHSAIFDALKKRDAVAARRAMEAHLVNAMDELEAHAAKSPELFAGNPKSAGK